VILVSLEHSRALPVDHPSQGDDDIDGYLFPQYIVSTFVDNFQCVGEFSDLAVVGFFVLHGHLYLVCDWSPSSFARSCHGSE